MLEKFRAAGRLTGNVSTAEITDATPAAAASHINARDCQGPGDMAACPTARKSVGGKGSIAEQLVDNQVDVLLGGGLDRFTQPLEDASETVLDYATMKWGYRSVTTAAELDAITDLSDGPVLGLFAPSNMTPKYLPLVATPPPGSGSPTTRCEPADTGTQPDLATMTRTAIDLLDNPDGLLPPGRERDDRQAGARPGHLWCDRGRGEARRDRRGGAGLPARRTPTPW